MTAIYTIIIITLILSAFFSGMEIAFVSSNKLKIFLEKEQGSIANKIVSKFTEKPTNFIISMLIGNNVALVIYGIYMAYLLEPVIEQYIISKTPPRKHGNRYVPTCNPFDVKVKRERNTKEKERKKRKNGKICK